MHCRPLVAIEKLHIWCSKLTALKFSIWLDGTVWVLIQHMTHFICLVSPSVCIIERAMKLGYSVTVCHLGGIRSGKHHCRYHIPTSPYVIQWFSSYTFNLKSTCYLLLNPQSRDSWLGKLDSPAEMALKKKSTPGLFFQCRSTLVDFQPGCGFKLHPNQRMKRKSIWIGSWDVDSGPIWQTLAWKFPIMLAYQ